ncbi:MAG: hypothetical protein MZW92_56300 [Comamonadaceae bacterium]|nr:hypothetical protein [Comamonadaceae bacterium]
MPRQQPVLARRRAGACDEAVAARRADGARCATTAAGALRRRCSTSTSRPQPGAGHRSAGERSLAVRLELLDTERTLTDERIDAAVAAAVDARRRRPSARGCAPEQRAERPEPIDRRRRTRDPAVAGDADADQGRTGRPAVRAARA